MLPTLAVSRFARACAALTFACAAAVQGAPLREFDALANAPAGKRGGVDAAALAKLGVRGHRDDRLGVPTFLWVGEGSPARAKALLAKDGVATAKSQLKALRSLYGVDAADIEALDAFDTQSLPGGGRLLRLRQRHAGIDVFREGVTLLSDRDGALAAVAGHLADVPPATGKSGPSTALGFLLDERAALGRVLDDHGLPGAELAAAATKQRADGAWRRLEIAATAKAAARIEPLRVKPVWFRLADGLVPAWYVESLVATPAGGERAFSHVISAKDGTLLFRHGLIAHDAYRYRAWADPATLRPLAGPQGNSFFPHPAGVPDGSQPPFVAPALVTLQNAPFSRNDPWLPPGANRLTGNNIEAFADLYAPDGFNSGDVRATPTAPDAFDRSYDVTRAPNADTTQVQAAITQAFYTGNWLHDAFYDAGFDEAAGNAQLDNFARGGLGNDSLRIDVQDASGLDNANMYTPADGARPRMQMFVFNGVSQATLVEFPGGNTRAASSAGFGPQLYNLSASMANHVDNVAAAGGGTLSDGCEAPVVSLASRVAVVDRGLCTFVQKAQVAQAAGAVALIVVNDSDTGPSPVGGSASGITIPVVGVSRADGIALRQRIDAATPGVTLSRSPAVNRDGSLDNGIVAHEWGHYISSRLVGDAAGLTTLQGVGMGEGWGDFHALMLLAGPGANPNGVYAAMGYANGGKAPNDSFYFGLRRYPYSTDLRKNPLTFRHIQDSAPLPSNVAGLPGGRNSESHNTGEVWASMLWECYAGLLSDTPRLSFAQAESRMKSYLVAGYKLTPNAPTLIEARDALLAAIMASDPKDFAICARGFAKRGAGAGAVAPARDAAGNEGVVESFVAEGGALSLTGAVLSDAIGACDLDGRLDGGELGTLELSLRNTGFSALDDTRVSVGSTSPGVSFPSGNSVAVAATAPYQATSAVIPVAYAPTAGAQTIDLALQWTDPKIATPGAATLSYRVNLDLVAQAHAHDDAEAPQPAWTPSLADTTNASKAWRRIELSPTEHRFLGPDGDGVGRSAWTSPPLQASPSAPLVITFRHRHDFEASAGTRWDGGVLEASTDDGGTWIDVGQLAAPTYNGMLAVSANNPLAERSAYTGRNPAWPELQDVTVSLGTAFAGQTVRFRFLIGTDLAAGGAGWEIDDIAVAGILNTPFPGLVAQRAACTSAGAAVPADRVFRNGFD
jgi:hypothetical protein